jgi:hypothetical protein
MSVEVWAKSMPPSERLPQYMDLPTPSAERAYVLGNRLLLLAVALAGIAHVAFLPPFEGFDEPAHLSYIEQIADTGTVPRYGLDKVALEIEQYPGPRAYADFPPYDQAVGRSYRTFFSSPSPRLPPLIEHGYSPGYAVNDEAQHPPLYYALMAPIYLMAKGWSWPDLFLLLRLVSWSLAFAGFAIGCRATQQSLRSLNVSPALCLLVPAWPFFFPEFFPEMARLGNDSLCLLLMGIGWYLLLRLVKEREAKTAILLGLVFGLGLLTKAFFLAILAGSLVLLCFQALRDRNGKDIQNALVVGVIAGVLGSGWYLFRLLTVGHFIFFSEIIKVEQHGSLLTQAIQGFTVLGLLHAIGYMATSFVWTGTYSFARFPPIYTVPLVMLAIVPLFNWLLRLRRAPTLVIAPLFIAGPMFGGLMYFLLTQMAPMAGTSRTPGWYFHILAGPLSLALVVGWRQRRILAALAAYALMFHAVAWAMQLSLFSGCAYKAGDYRYVQFDHVGCFVDPGHLAVLGEPMLGGLALAAALAAGAFGLMWSRHTAAPALR